MRLFKEKKRNQYDVVIVTDFKDINPNIFFGNFNSISEIKKENILCSKNGIIFINKKYEYADLLYDLFNILSCENKDTLQEYAEKYGKLYPNIKTFDDWKSMNSTNEKKLQALSILCVPVELQRREVMAKYFYGSTQNQ